MTDVLKTIKRLLATGYSVGLPHIVLVTACNNALCVVYEPEERPEA